VPQWQMYLFVQDSSDLMVNAVHGACRSTFPDAMALSHYQSGTHQRAPTIWFVSKVTLGSLHYPAHRINGTPSQ
jgi:hypothetical protein